jgi:hypothetical protein
MGAGILLTMLATVLTFPVAVLAQSQPAPEPSELRQELKHKRFLVLPKPSPETVARDTDQAIDEMTAPERVDRLIRESRERPLSRPELDSSIVNSIQADRALRLLRR